MKKHQIIARKYRPQTFREIVGQDVIVKTLKNALHYEQSAYAYLFSGSRGIGKTTIARLLAKTLNCENIKELEPCNICSSCKEISSGQSLDVIEIDGASNRGIDDIRQINETAAYSPSKGKFRIYIIDEVHMLTKEAFNALLKTLEEPPNLVKFFFATTEVHKVPPTILSRCQRFDLKRITTKSIVEKLQTIASDLNKEITSEALHLIASYSDGSLRDAESTLEQVFCYETDLVSEQSVYELLGLLPKTHFFNLDQAFEKQTFSFAFDLAKKIFEAGLDIQHFVQDLIEHYRNILVVKLLSAEQIFSETQKEQYKNSAKRYTKEQCHFILDYLLNMIETLKNSSHKRVSLEMILLQILRSKNRLSLQNIVQKLTEHPFEKPSPALEPPSAEKIQEAKPPLTLVDTPLQYDNPASPEHKPVQRYETLMRFAAVELEGSLKTENMEKKHG